MEELPDKTPEKKEAEEFEVEEISAVKADSTMKVDPEDVEGTKPKYAALL